MPRSPRSSERRRALAFGVLFAVALTAAGVAWLRADAERCPTADRRIGVTEGPDGWTAEARYQRWDDGDRCRARIRVALFAPGGTWEDEALVPAALLEAPADPDAVPRGALRWEDDAEIVVASVRVPVPPAARAHPSTHQP